MNWFANEKNHSLKKSLIVFSMVLILGSLFIIGSISSYLVYQSRKLEASNRNKIINHTLLHNIQKNLGSIIHDMEVLKKSIDQKTFGLSQIQILMNNLESSKENGTDMFLKIQLANQKGTIVLVSPYSEETIGTDVSGFTYFKKAKQSQAFFWGDTIISNQLGEPVTSISIQTSRGILSAFIQRNHFIQLIKNIPISPMVQIAMIDSSGTYILHSNPEKVLQRDVFVYYHRLKKIYRGNTLGKEISLDNRKVISYIDFVKDSEWAIIIFQPYDVFSAPIKQFFIWFLAIIAFFIILIFLLSNHKMKKITDNISALVSHTFQIANGNYQKLSENIHYFEFQELLSSFKKMSSKVEKREILYQEVNLQLTEELKMNKKIQSDLNKAHAFLSTVLDQAPFAILLTEGDTQNWSVSNVNKHFQKLLGSRYSNILHKGKKNNRLNITKTDIPLFTRKRKWIIDLIQNSLSSKKTIENLEIILRAKDESEQFFLLSTSPIYEKGNQMLGCISIFTDITKIKKAEQNLLNSEEKLRHIFNSLDDIGLFIIANNSYSFKILEYNPGAENLFGYKHFKQLRELFSNDHDFKKIESLITQSLVTSKNHSLEKNLINSEKKVFPALIRITPLNPPDTALVLIIDITERKKAQNLMVQHEKMASIAGLAAGIAHEINNPLSIILQSMQNIKRRLKENHPKNQETANNLKITLNQINQYLENRKIQTYLKAIHEAAERSSSILRTMLQFSRKSNSSRQKADIHDLIYKSLDLARNDFDFKNRYDFKHIQLILKFAEHIPLIECTPSEIEQVILNIVKNAAQAMFEAKNPQEKPLITITTSSDPKKITITIQDNGPGIPEEVLEHIFEPFYTTKGVGGGTGLGLSVSYFIIKDNHQGDIIVSSSSKKGTTFRITLPLQL